jgi:hypothetical protein
MSSQEPFSYQEHEINTLEVGLSIERFSGYVTATQGDRLQAVKRYERNTALSEALYGVVQGFEVVFRNGLNAPLARALGPEWYHVFRFGSAQRDAVCEAEQKILKNGKLVTPARMVSRLTFGFWAALVGPSYEKKLWVPYLHRAFPNAIQHVPLSTGELKAVKIPRHRIAERVESIKILRNRIAHHEAILDLATEETYSRILEAIDWICPTTATWVTQTNCFPERFRRAI